MQNQKNNKPKKNARNVKKRRKTSIKQQHAKIRKKNARKTHD